MSHLRWMTGPPRLSLFGFLAAVALALPGCATIPAPERALDCNSAPSPEIVHRPGSATESTTLKVLTYNIEGLGFPARRGRAAELRRIGETLAALRSAGTGPDIVLFQEMFSDAARRAVAESGYPAIASGPGRTARRFEHDPEKLPGKPKLKRGEVGVRLLGSGLAIASRYPIVATDMRAYAATSCAGIDCLSNKGIMLATIFLPGVPAFVDVYNTHMNSRGASRAPERRNLAAHSRQAREASEFIGSTGDESRPVVFGGDFNMRHSEARWDSFTEHQSMDLVHRVCASEGSGCEVRMSWDGDVPWMDTQDLQFFSSGNAVSIRPVRVEAMFDGSPGNPRLSDHDGLLVTYRLEWRSDAPQARCATPVPIASLRRQ